MSDIATQFCSFFEALPGSEESAAETSHYELLHEQNNLPDDLVGPLGHQLRVILDFDDQKQETAAFLGREGGLDEFLSILFPGESVFFLESAKMALSLDLLTGDLSQEELRQWPAWKLQELLEFLYYRVRALERSRRLTLTGRFDPALIRGNKMKGPAGAGAPNDREMGRPLTKLLNVTRSGPRPQKAQPFSTIPDLFQAQTRQRSWKFVEESATATPTLVESPTGYLLEAGGQYDNQELVSNLAVQEADLDISYYEEYFDRRVHYNFLANDEGGKGPVVLSMVQSDDCVRILLRTFDEDVRLKTTAPVKIPHMLKNIRYWYPSLAKVKFYQVKDLAIEKSLLKIERNHVTYNYKFGVLYCREGQVEENDMFSNEHGSDEFNEFLAFLGEEITLKGFEGFAGGLDTKRDTTGTHSIYTESYGYEIMFHVSTLLPYVENDPQKLERKRHLGNDVVVIVFKEGDVPFRPDCIRSEFNHVFVVVQKTGTDSDGNTLYRLEMTCKDSVPLPWSPFLPDPPIFRKDDSFREWLLTKLINAERACMHTPGFVNKFQRTRKMLFTDLLERFVPPHALKKLHNSQA